jgi:hypothetical protein
VSDEFLLFTNEVYAEFEDISHPIITRPVTEFIPFRCTLDRLVDRPLSSVYTSIRTVRATKLQKPFLEGKVVLRTG